MLSLYLYTISYILDTTYELVYFVIVHLRILDPFLSRKDSCVYFHVEFLKT